MKVFVSWSGVASRAVAEAFADWLPKVIQGVEPFVSAKDIDKGSNWTVELARELEDAQFGIICLAPDNLLSPWLNYETGAITKSVDSRVCPVLFHVRKEEVLPPMGQLQLTSIDLEEVNLLVGSINKAAGSPLTTHAVRESVEVWWPRLEALLAKIEVPDASPITGETAPAEPVQPQVDVTEMFEELLRRMRSLDDRVRRLEPFVGSPTSTRGRSKDTLAPAMKFLERKMDSVGLHGAYDVRQVDDRLEIRLDDLAETPNELAAAAQTIARIEKVDVEVQSGSGVRRWSAGRDSGPSDEA